MSTTSHVTPVAARDALRSSLAWNSWKPAAFVAALTVIACGVASFVLPSLFGDHEWLTTWDGWWTVQGAQWVSHGAVGTIYGGDSMYLPLPGFLFLLAPVVALGGHLGLVTSFPIPLRHPSMWLLVGPAFFVAGSTCVLGADYLADTLGVPVRRRCLIAFATGLAVVVPTCVRAGHPEDLLALALSCLSLALLLRRRFLGAALVLSLAVMMQPWAVLLIPVLAAASPAGRRLGALIWSAALPGACALMLFSLDFPDTWRSLVKQPMLGHGQHLPWLGLAGHMMVMQGGVPVHARVGSATRSLALIAAVTAAGWVLRKPNPYRIMVAASVALLARGMFETQFWCWYVAPAAVMMVLAAGAFTVGSRKRWVVAAISAFVVYGFAAAAYDNYSLPAWLALAILVCAGGLAIWLPTAHRDEPDPSAEPESQPRVPDAPFELAARRA